MSVHFTWHATQRLSERSIMKQEELVEIIKKERYIVVGFEGRKQHRQQLLLYSISDGVHMVLIYDYNRKSVITILPIEYHSVLTKEILEEAYVLSGIAPPPKKPEVKISKPKIEREAPGRVAVTAILSSKKRKSIGHIPVVNNFNLVVNTLEFSEWVESRVKDEKFPVVQVMIGGIPGKQGYKYYRYVRRERE